MLEEEELVGEEEKKEEDGDEVEVGDREGGVGERWHFLIFFGNNLFFIGGS